MIIPIHQSYFHYFSLIFTRNQRIHPLLRQLKAIHWRPHPPDPTRAPLAAGLPQGLPRMGDLLQVPMDGVGFNDPYNKAYLAYLWPMISGQSSGDVPRHVHGLGPKFRDVPSPRHFERTILRKNVESSHQRGINTKPQPLKES